ncbi:MAG TPA: hypothetical protein VJJ52_04855 [Candidatus Nanoarchaeia archaeon]|nr:hypothetical protein [Candidatus Nanoarchaeia archaeon]
MKMFSILVLLVSVALCLVFVKAQTNNTVPYLDPKILEEFNKASEVRVIVKVIDTTGITVTSKDSQEEQAIKDSKKQETLGRKTDLVLSRLPESEFKLKGIFLWRDGFYGYITKPGLDILMNNSDVGAIYLDGIASVGGPSFVIINNRNNTNESTEQEELKLKIIENETPLKNVSSDKNQKSNLTMPQKNAEQELKKETKHISIFSKFINFLKSFLFHSNQK